MDWIYPTPGPGNLQGDQCKCVSRLLPLSWWPPCWQENIDSQRPGYSRAQLRRALGYRVGCKTRKYRGQSMALVHTTHSGLFLDHTHGWVGDKVYICKPVYRNNHFRLCILYVSVMVGMCDRVRLYVKSSSHVKWNTRSLLPVPSSPIL